MVLGMANGESYQHEWNVSRLNRRMTMNWKIKEYEGRFLVCRRTWHSADWMGIEKKDIRVIMTGGDKVKTYTVEVFADCKTRELAQKLLQLKRSRRI
jgi:hypothetical protein